MNVTRPALVLAALMGVSLVASFDAPGVVTAAATGTSAAKASTILPFIADDYTRAVAEARARKVPIFIEAWAPW